MKAEKLCIVLASAGIVLGAHAAVTWQTVTAGTTLTIPCGTGQNTANLNFGRAEGFNLCCDDGVTIAVTDLASGNGAKLFSTIVEEEPVSSTTSPPTPFFSAHSRR